jgi:hypothetical protein
MKKTRTNLELAASEAASGADLQATKKNRIKIESASTRYWVKLKNSSKKCTTFCAFVRKIGPPGHPQRRVRLWNAHGTSLGVPLVPG